MGFRGINFGSLLLIFFIIALLFGTKRLRELGSDLGAAVKSFRKSMSDENDKDKDRETLS